MKKKYPIKYIPKSLSRKNALFVKKEIDKSNKLYKSGKYHIRGKVKTTRSKRSKHLQNVKKYYGIDKIKIDRNLVRKTGCTKKSLLKIFKKGQGAYFTGSRPNQTPHSWGLARLASSITGSKSSSVDFKELVEGCKKGSKALRLAKRSRKIHGKGTRKVPKE